MTHKKGDAMATSNYNRTHQSTSLFESLATRGLAGPLYQLAEQVVKDDLELRLLEIEVDRRAREKELRRHGMVAHPESQGRRTVKKGKTA